MLDALQETIRRLLRVPPEPEPPLGDPRSVRIFRASRGFYRYKLAGWGLKQAGAVVGIVFALVFLGFIPDSPSDALPDSFPEPLTGLLHRAFGWVSWLGIVEALAIAFFLLQLPASFLLLTLDYHYRWYVTTDRSLRIREGIWRVQERTMTFSNVQNLTIRQGPIQRLFGIADLQVQTAGGGGQQSGGEQQEGLADNLHIGYFRGVDNAAEIRDSILGHLRRLRGAKTPDGGLGDPDGPAHPEPPPAAKPAPGELLAAAREVLRQTRALRASLRPASTA